MKKLLSLLMSVCLSAVPLTVTDTYADSGEVGSMVIFGDSIASGYGLDPDKEYTYGQICGDYLGCDVFNYAQSGQDSAGLVEQIESLDDVQKQTLADTDIVIISTGGNDIIGLTSLRLLNFAGNNGFLNEGYTKDDIPEDPGVSDMMKMLNFKGKGSLQEYVENGGYVALNNVVSELSAISKDLRLTTGSNKYGQNKGIIHNEIMENIKTSVTDIREINPDVRIIVQTVYQPLQFSQEFVNSEYGAGSNYATMLTTLRTTYHEIMDTFRKELGQLDGIEIADVFYEFTALDSTTPKLNKTPGYAWYFTNIQCPMKATQEGGKTKDIHPNQKGHLAISSVILDTIGIKNTSLDTLYASVFRSIEDNKKYPLIAYRDYLKNIDITPGDITDDTHIDSVDASNVLAEYSRISTGKSRTFDNRLWTMADINHDGDVDSIDSSNMLAYYSWLSRGNSGNLYEYMYLLETGFTATIPLE